MELTDRQLQNIQAFLMETFLLDKEQLAAVDMQTQMTQKLFDSIVEKYYEMGDLSDKLFLRLIQDFPEFAADYTERMEQELADVELPEQTEEEIQASWEKLCNRIRSIHGEDAI